MDTVEKEGKTMNSFGKTMSITELLHMASETGEDLKQPSALSEVDEGSKPLPPEEVPADTVEKAPKKEPSKRKAKKEPLPGVVKQSLGSEPNAITEWMGEVERSRNFVLCRIPRDVQVVLHFISRQMQVPQWATLGYLIEEWIKNNYPEFMKWTETGKNR